MTLLEPFAVPARRDESPERPAELDAGGRDSLHASSPPLIAPELSFVWACLLKLLTADNSARQSRGRRSFALINKRRRRRPDRIWHTIAKLDTCLNFMAQSAKRAPFGPFLPMTQLSYLLYACSFLLLFSMLIRTQLPQSTSARAQPRWLLINPLSSAFSLVSQSQKATARALKEAHFFLCPTT